jgi:hypothetical protein
VREREQALEAEIVEAVRSISDKPDGTVEALSLAPKRGQISVQFVGLGWVPDA